METEIEISLPKSNADRPERFPCSECGRTFTKLGYIYHKKTCSEKEDCQCAVCAISAKTIEKPRVEQSVTNESFYQVLSDGPVSNTSDYSSGTSDNIQETGFEKNSYDDLNDSDDNLNADDGNHESFKSDFLKKEFPISVAANENLNEESQSSMSTIIDEDTSETIISTQSEGFYSAITSSYVEPEEDKQNEKAYVYAEISEISKDHGGLPCTRKLFCIHCQQHVYWEQFGLHILQHGQRINNSGYIKCPECNKSYSRPTMLLLHYFIHVSTHPLDCQECRCHYDQCIDTTARTVAEHCYAETYHCYICLKLFSHEQSIANHMRLHSEEMPYRCKVCDRCFRQVGNLQRHMATHRGDKPHRCSNCPKSFADPATLRNHVRVHTGETPYVCTMCKRGFTQVGNLKRHMVLHLKNHPSDSIGQTNKSTNQGRVPSTNSSGENEGESDKSASANESVTDSKSGVPLSDSFMSTQPEVNQNESMDVDKVRDTAQEYQSAVEELIASNCSKDKVPSILKSSRGRKRNGHFKIFACPDCNKIYTWKHDLQVHIRTHTGEKPYACDICDKRFAQSGAVRTHLARHHSNKETKRKKSNK